MSVDSIMEEGWNKEPLYFPVAKATFESSAGLEGAM
jgi:hypothetical protein